MKYRRLRGSLNIGMRVERGAALLAAMFANWRNKDGGYLVNDFMPHNPRPELTLEEAMEAWA